MGFLDQGVIGYDTFLRMFINGWVVDGRGGGLVVGRRHSEGHIVMICPSDERIGEFLIAGVMEGGEYLMSTTATEREEARIRQINSFKGLCESTIAPTEASRIIHTSDERHDKLLLINRQFIINRDATRKSFAELEAINAKYPTSNGWLFTDEEVDFLDNMPTPPGPLD